MDLHSLMYRHTCFFDSVKKFLLIDCLSVTACAGLSGKAGVALALFELSREESLLEDFASALFQDALAAVGDDCYYTGSLGVGLVLNYLIDSRLIDADFQELYGDKHEQIVKYVFSDNYEVNQIPDLLLYFHASGKRTESNRKCMDFLLVKLQSFIEQDIQFDWEFFRKWYFIRTYCRKNETLNRITRDTTFPKIHSDLPVIQEQNTGKLIDSVDSLFRSLTKKNVVEACLNDIVHSKINFHEPGLNLALSRLLVLFANQGNIPPKLLFFFYNTD